MYVEGYNKKPNPHDAKDDMQERFNEIKHLLSHITINLVRSFSNGDKIFGTLDTDKAKGLNLYDLIIVLSHGNLAEGGTVLRNGNKFECFIYKNW